VLLDLLEELSRSDLREEKLRINFDRAYILRCLEANKHTYETTCYYLLERHMQEMNFNVKELQSVNESIETVKHVKDVVMCSSPKIKEFSAE
jgi:hypothetical protein